MLPAKTNNIAIFAGAMDFPDNSRAWRKHTILREHLKQGENCIIIENTTKDDKIAKISGNAGPAKEAFARDSNWGNGIVAAIKLTGLP